MKINAKQFQEMFENEKEGLEIVDVRDADEFDEVRVHGSKLIPLNEIEQRQGEIDWNKKVILVCRSGARSGFAQEILRRSGKTSMNLEGGIGVLEIAYKECLER